MKTILFALAIILAAHSGLAQAPKAAKKKANPVKLTLAELKTDQQVYKKTPQGELSLHFHFPAGWSKTDQRPMILFFFGGAWSHGSVDQFLPQAEYFAARGLVTARAEYRINSLHQTKPDACVEDAKSAVRWLRNRAGELGIDPQKLIASGGSAGGHLAAATALVEAFNDANDNLKISAVPNALVLFNPALNMSEVGRPISDASGKNIGKLISPTEFLKKGTPPAILFFGTADRLLSHGEEFLAKSKPHGNRVELFTAAEMGHGFFNRSPWTESTARQTDEFLISLGYLKGKPTLAAPAASAALKLQK